MLQRLLHKVSQVMHRQPLDVDYLQFVIDHGPFKIFVRSGWDPSKYYKCSDRAVNCAQYGGRQWTNPLPDVTVGRKAGTSKLQCIACTAPDTDRNVLINHPNCKTSWNICEDSETSFAWIWHFHKAVLQYNKWWRAGQFSKIYKDKNTSCWIKDDERDASSHGPPCTVEESVLVDAPCGLCWYFLKNDKAGICGPKDIFSGRSSLLDAYRHKP